MFKCKCLTFLYQRITGIWIMSGAEYNVHENSFVWYCKHTGLNRVKYKITDFDSWLNNTNPEIDETFWVPVKRRRAKIKYHFRNHYKR